MARPRQHIDLARLEELAAEQHRLTQREIALHLGVSFGTLTSRMIYDPSAREALRRGRMRRKREEETSEVCDQACAPQARPLTRSEIVVSAIRRGARTYGKLLAVTQLEHTALVLTVQDLAARGVVFAREVDGARLHFVTGETLTANEAAQPDVMICESCGRDEKTERHKFCG